MDAETPLFLRVLGVPLPTDTSAWNGEQVVAILTDPRPMLPTTAWVRFGRETELGIATAAWSDILRDGQAILAAGRRTELPSVRRATCTLDVEDLQEVTRALDLSTLGSLEGHVVRDRSDGYVISVAFWGARGLHVARSGPPELRFVRIARLLLDRAAYRIHRDPWVKTHALKMLELIPPSTWP